MCIRYLPFDTAKMQNKTDAWSLNAAVTNMQVVLYLDAFSAQDKVNMA